MSFQERCKLGHRIEYLGLRRRQGDELTALIDMPLGNVAGALKSHQRIAAMVGISIQMVMKYSRHIDRRLATRGTGEEHASAKFRKQ